MRNSDLAWQRWGEADPYYGVLADARFRGDTLADHLDEFWASGELHVRKWLARAEQHFGLIGRARALDFGCGVGRLSLPMARRFNAVVGLDIAPAMRGEARRNALEAGIANLDILPADDALSAVTGEFDLVMSCMVFQHIPVFRGMPILRHLLERTRQGGIASLHLCTDRRDGLLSGLHYRAQCAIPGAHALTNVLRGRPVSEPLMQMNAYPLGEVLNLASFLGFGPALVFAQSHGRYQAAQLLLHRAQRGGA